MAISLSTAARNAATNAVTGLVGATGTIKIYSGAKPASPNDAATGTLLATVALGAWGASAAGTSAGADPVSVNAAATGVAGWFRVEDSAGAAVFDGLATATGGGGDMQLSSTSLTSGGAVDITSLSYTTPAGS